jgi:hypothetical protein
VAGFWLKTNAKKRCNEVSEETGIANLRFEIEPAAELFRSFRFFVPSR